MSRKSVVSRQIKREKQVFKFKYKREEIKAKIRDNSLDFEEKMNLSFELQKMPRDSSSCRLRNRCSITGRSKGVYRLFGLCRNQLREKAMLGEIPGLRKSSW